MTSQFTKMLQFAQSDYQNSLQQSSSVDAFFASANQNGSMLKMPSSQPVSINNGGTTSLEQIERQIKKMSPPRSNVSASPLNHHEIENGQIPTENNNSPLAQFFSNNNNSQFKNLPAPPQKEPKATKPMNGRAPPGFATKPVQLITPTMLAEKKTKPEPLTQNQLLQAFNYLIANDDEFKLKLHDAYVKSFLGSTS